MPLVDYVDARNAGIDGLAKFVATFKACVVDRDEEYYQPILRDLLTGSGITLNHCCLTDLCKASFVERGGGPEDGNRGDRGSDQIVRTFWLQWVSYLIGVEHEEGDVPLPYRWLWQRMQHCQLIVALGTIAEYGVLKVFHHMARKPKTWTWKDRAITPDHPTMTAQASYWKYGYACTKRKLRHWPGGEDWWVLNDVEMRYRHLRSPGRF
ncbi:MAG: hypothetical protein AB7J34_01705 [Limisphaerales bacterium]